LVSYRCYGIDIEHERLRALAGELKSLGISKGTALTLRAIEDNITHEGNRIRREGDAAPEGKTLKGESQECKGYEIRP
jgi:hypothetical protein